MSMVPAGGDRNCDRNSRHLRRLRFFAHATVLIESLDDGGTVRRYGGDPPWSAASPGDSMQDMRRRGAIEDRRLVTGLLLMISLSVLAAAIVLGGPRTGYIPGTVVATTAVVWLDRRFRLPASKLWVLVAVAVTYFAGGSILIGGDTLSHQSFGFEPLRYDHLLHAFTAAVSVHIVWLGAPATSSLGSRPVNVVVFVSLLGLAVEALELLHAVVMPSLFHYDVPDSVRDVVGNTVGIAIGVSVMWSRSAGQRNTSVTTNAPLALRWAEPPKFAPRECGDARGRASQTQGASEVPVGRRNCSSSSLGEAGSREERPWATTADEHRVRLSWMNSPNPRAQSPS